MAMTDRMLHTDDIFDLHSAQTEKVYIDDSSAHLTARGNKMVEEFLYKHLKGELDKLPKSRRIVPSYYSTKLQ